MNSSMNNYNDCKPGIENINNIFFIGIGGVSMSSLASILLLKGKKVFGYDMNRSEITEDLEKKGAIVSYDENIDIPSIVDTVVYTAAMSEKNSLMIKARNSGATVLTRAELLGLIANSYNVSIGISGTHGKSTTTGFISSVCLCHDEETAVLSGANLPFLGAYYKSADGERIVYEACEYKDSYHSMVPSIKVILNCEHDHIDYFPTLDSVINSFRKFINLERFEGSQNVAVVNYDCENCRKACENSSSNIYYYSVNTDVDYFAYDISMEKGFGVFSVKLPDNSRIEDIHLSVPGFHNISNAVAAVAASHLAGVPSEDIKSGIESFKGVSRRFERIGDYNGAFVFDDYAHHPDEIKVTLKTARLMNPKRLICVFQPHTFSRTYGFLDEFAEALSLADKVYLCDIFPARETNIYGISSQNIASKMNNAQCISDFNEIAAILKSELSEGDFCITMGAGRANEISKMLVSDNH